MRPTEEKIQKDPSDLPIYLFKQGNNCEAYRYFGAHLETRAGESGVVFRVLGTPCNRHQCGGRFQQLEAGQPPDAQSGWGILSGSCSSPA